jgi:menaquinone-dependent protoporphyrinogen oxidase
MKAVIVYDSLHGSTEKCARQLRELINGDVQTVSLQKNHEINLNDFDTVIIGGSIHMGVIQTRVENFISKNQAQLLEKQIGLYLCCMEEGDVAQQQFNKAYPDNLRNKAKALGLFGGEFNLRKMSFFEKKLTRKLTGITSSVSKINEEAIRSFAEKF